VELLIDCNKLTERHWLISGTITNIFFFSVINDCLSPEAAFARESSRIPSVCANIMPHVLVVVIISTNTFTVK
jgi:hypothetical protein